LARFLTTAHAMPMLVALILATLLLLA